MLPRVLCKKLNGHLTRQKDEVVAKPFPMFIILGNCPKKPKAPNDQKKKQEYSKADQGEAVQMRAA